MLQKMIEAIKASKREALIAKLGDQPTEDRVFECYDELRRLEATEAADAARATQGAAATTTGASSATATTTVAKATTTATSESGAAAAAAVTQMTEAEIVGMRRKFGQLVIDSSVHGCALPEVLKTRMKARLGKVLEAQGTIDEAYVIAQIKEEVETYGELAKAGVVLPATAQQVTLGAGPSDKFREALDNFWDPAKPATSFRAIYVQFTGDEKVTGRVSEAKRLSEAVGSGTFDQAMADALNKRMVKDYQGSPKANWRGVIADVVPLRDFRTQRRIRWGGYGNLPIVAEKGPYTALTTPGDEQATYTPAKRGGTESISLEAIKNDDVGILRRIPGKLANAAAQTLHEFAWDFLATNAVIYDAVALAAAGHNNIVTTAISEANVASLRLKMKQQADMSNGKRIGLTAVHLIGPTDLEELIFKITRTEKVLGSANNDRNFVNSLGLKPVIVDYWTDVSDYWVTADPSQTEMIEIGFIDGQEDPQLFLQDNPTMGSMFTHDVLTYKLAHAYGGAVLEFRGFAGGIVP